MLIPRRSFRKYFSVFHWRNESSPLQSTHSDISCIYHYVCIFPFFVSSYFQLFFKLEDGLAPSDLLVGILGPFSFLSCLSIPYLFGYRNSILLYQSSPFRYVRGALVQFDQKIILYRMVSLLLVCLLAASALAATPPSKANNTVNTFAGPLKYNEVWNSKKDVPSRLHCS